MAERSPGPGFLKQRYGLHKSEEVASAASRTQGKTDEEIPKSQEAQIQNYLDRFKEIVEREDEGHRERGLEALKRLLHRKFVIKSRDVPESTFLLEQRILREQGHGDVEITEEFKDKKTNEVISNQKNSLNRWVDYLASDDAMYPDWAKYWAMRSVTEMGKLKKREVENKEGEDDEMKLTASFGKRKKDTIASFATLNPKALALSIAVMKERLEIKQKPKKERQPVENKSRKLSNPEFNHLLSSESFSKIYSQFLLEMPEYSTEGLKETRGEWTKYEQGSDAQDLVDSLEGYPLEWCTAAYNTARTQLQSGDFYVYYSYNEDAEAKIPRVAIRMEQGSIAEVRGIAPDQNVDPYISDVVRDKMDEFPDGESYKKKSGDMKRLTEIEEKWKKKRGLSKSDIIFLYEIKLPVEGFGYEKDPRVAEILEGRNLKQDIAFALDIREDQVSTTRQEALTGDIKFHKGDLNLMQFFSSEGLTLPETMNGDLYLNGLTSAEGLTLPETMNGYLYLSGLTSAEGLTLPETMNGSLDLSGLTSAEGLTLPETMNGDLYLNGLTSAEGLTLPETMNGDLYLDGFTENEKMKLRIQYPNLTIY